MGNNVLTSLETDRIIHGTYLKATVYTKKETS